MTVKPFLYLDNWHAPQPETRFDRAIAASGLTVETCRTNLGEFPSDHDYCGVYVSPSFDAAYDDLPWVHRLHKLLPELAARQTPMIGLCFGCQVLASALVGRDTVFKRATHEGGRGTIVLSAAARNDPLCHKLPERFDVYHWHGDEVVAKREEIIVLADGAVCGNHLWRWSDGPVWGVQPHPEMAEPDLRAWFSQNRLRFENNGHDVEDYLAQCFTADLGFSVLERFLETITAPQTPVS